MTKPTKIKELSGTLRPSRQLDNEMTPPTVEEVEKPTGLVNDFADKEWIKVTGVLSNLGMLIDTDTSLLLAYCNEMGKYFDCIEIIKNEGYTLTSKGGGVYQRPEVGIANTALANGIKLADKFGFNPAARTKIEMPVQPPKDDFADL